MSRRTNLAPSNDEVDLMPLELMTSNPEDMGSTVEDRPWLALHPFPVACRNCGTILQASYVAENDFCCPHCGEQVCYACGCVEHDACNLTVTSRDGAHSETYPCTWAEPGCCTFCMYRAAYEFYQEVNGEPADDPYYMGLGCSVCAVKGLGSLV